MGTLETRLERLERQLGARDRQPLIAFMVGVNSDGTPCEYTRGGTLDGESIERLPSEPLEAFEARIVETFPPARGVALAVYMLSE